MQVNLKTLLAILLLALSVSAQTPKPRVVNWVGLFVGPATTGPWRQNPFDHLRQRGGFEVNAITGIGKRCNVQNELIFTRDGTLTRFALACKVL